MESSDIRHKVPFHFIRYASVWEDSDILCEALAPVAKDHSLLSIASAGDNALALLTLDPSCVVAVDLNVSQIACLELHLAAFNRLDLEEIWAFLGFMPCQNRLSTYRKIRSDMSKEAIEFWDGLPQAIEQGVMHAGKFERYLRSFGAYLLPLIHSKKIRQALFEERSLEERRLFYQKNWNNRRWRGLFQIFFSRFLMGRLGRDPVFFDQVEGHVATRIFKRTQHALTELEPWKNPYLRYIVTGNYSQEAMPTYLRPENFTKIRSNLARVQVKTCPIEASSLGPYKGYNLSDLFEYLDQETFQNIYGQLVQQSLPGARLCYWNMLVPRSCPNYLTQRVHHLSSLSSKLHHQDKAWFYQAFKVDEVQA